MDEETGVYYYGARYYNPRESVWLSTDPLSGYNPVMEVEHYIDGQHNGGIYNSFNHNTYGYCYQNPIIFKDPNGKQTDVTWMQKGVDDDIIEASKKVSNLPNTLQVLAHGNPDLIVGVTSKNEKFDIDGPNTFNNALKGNSLWNSNKGNENFTVILYACRTGNYSESKSRSKTSIVQRISKAYPNIKFIAPSHFGWFNKGFWIFGGLEGTYGKDAKNNFDGSNPGYWFVYKNGEILEAYDATWEPGTSSTRHKVDLNDITTDKLKTRPDGNDNNTQKNDK